MTERQVQHSLVAFGGNLQPNDENLQDRVRSGILALQSDSVKLIKISPLYGSKAYPPGSGPDFVNGAAEIQSTLEPEQLLAHLHAVEARFGRVRTERWGPRTLDLDLIATGEAVLPDAATQDQWRDLSPDQQKSQAPDRLILPHPRLQDRAFVLVPLADIAPDWRHPRLGLTVRQMLSRLDPADIAAITPL